MLFPVSQSKVRMHHRAWNFVATEGCLLPSIHEMCIRPADRYAKKVIVCNKLPPDMSTPAGWSIEDRVTTRRDILSRICPVTRLSRICQTPVTLLSRSRQTETVDISIDVRQNIKIIQRPGKHSASAPAVAKTAPGEVLWVGMLGSNYPLIPTLG